MAESMDPTLLQLLEEIASLQQELTRAIAANDTDAAERLLANLSVLERRRNRLVHRSVDGTPAYTTVRSMRDQVIQPLQLLARPASLGLVTDLSSARWGEPIPTRRLASLRRDEQASYEARPGGRSVYIAPALTADRFSVIRGVLTLSSWPLEVRIAGPVSPRVDLLHSVIRLSAELDAGRTAGAAWAPSVERLVLRLARTVPSALAAGKEVETSRVRQSCADELAAIEPDDIAVRVAAAERARRQLGDEQQVFGVRMDVIAGGKLARGSP